MWKRSGKKCEWRALWLLGEEQQERYFGKELRRLDGIQTQRQGGYYQGRLDNQVARGAIVACQVCLDEGLCLTLWMVLSVTTFLRGDLRRLRMVMMLLAGNHGLRGIALQGQPQQHEGEHESGQEQFHLDQPWLIELRTVINITETLKDCK